MELSNRQMVSMRKKSYVIDEDLELISRNMANGAKKLDEISREMYEVRKEQFRPEY